MITLIKADFTIIGQVALHCDQRKLDIAINEAIQFDLRPMLCDFFWKLNDEWDSEEKLWRQLIDGGSYKNCKDNNVSFMGMKNALVYFAYSRYIIINSFDDTPNGQVTKTNQFTIPKPLKEMEAYATKYKNMAMIALKDTEKYICKNEDEDAFESYDFRNCELCTCTSCEPHTQARGFGLRSNNITKFEVGTRYTNDERYREWRRRTIRE